MTDDPEQPANRMSRLLDFLKFAGAALVPPASLALLRWSEILDPPDELVNVELSAAVVASVAIALLCTYERVRDAAQLRCRMYVFLASAVLGLIGYVALTALFTTVIDDLQGSRVLLGCNLVGTSPNGVTGCPVADPEALLSEFNYQPEAVYSAASLWIVRVGLWATFILSATSTALFFAVFLIGHGVGRHN